MKKRQFSIKDISMMDLERTRRFTEEIYRIREQHTRKH